MVTSKHEGRDLPGGLETCDDRGTTWPAGQRLEHPSFCPDLWKAALTWKLYCHVTAVFELIYPAPPVN